MRVAHSFARFKFMRRLRYNIYRIEYTGAKTRDCGSQSPVAFRSFGSSKSMAITLIVQFLVGLPPSIQNPASPVTGEQWVTNQRRWLLNLARSRGYGYVSPNDAWNRRR